MLQSFIEFQAVQTIRRWTDRILATTSSSATDIHVLLDADSIITLVMTYDNAIKRNSDPKEVDYLSLFKSGAYSSVGRATDF